MKKTLILLSIIITPLFSYGQDDSCARRTTFGSATICLPTLEGYEECFNYSGIQELLDKTSVPINEEIGFYLNTSTYSERHRIMEFQFDDYIKIYGTKSIKDLHTNTEILREAQKEMVNYFSVKKWEDIHKEIDKIGLDLEIGAPTVVKQYEPNDQSFTYIMFANYSLDSKAPFVMGIAMSGVIIDSRLIWISYYLNYENEDTFVELEAKSNEIVNKTLSAN